MTAGQAQAERAAAQDNYALARAEEREDVLAYFKRRRAACDTMMRRDPGEAERAGIMVQQLDVLIGDVSAGLHEGELATALAISTEPAGDAGERKGI